MNASLWALQIALAAVFAAAGIAKIALPHKQLRATLGDWVDAIPLPAVKMLGVAELAAAVGLTVPPAVAVAPILTPLAGIGVIAVLAGAVIIHGRRHEYPNVAVNIVLAVAAALVVWGRLGPYAF
jgi:uncharacterized membrane protein YphA (DoxX/SURF4 family)